MTTSTITRPRRVWREVEEEVRRHARALPNVDRLNGGAPRELAPTLVVARRPVEPDASVVPARFPALDWPRLAVRRLRGDDVGPEVRVRLRDACRGRASSPGQVLALRTWLRDVAIPEALAKVDADALVLARAQVEEVAA